ncbi:hypothetical protein KJE20_06868 [Pyrenophora tritici-repentis]|uniref:Uncharacterized protein n=1 Tax=Pyrenophora tritici-repentis TaxID=45151 RepID=A0A922N202_9PLEO|nr:hypothetical protein Ptr86124_013190 [Pyrenophora tritici-repentis]KAI1676517.1 hypothetical protein KJE20_13943 [Pyrenophora tritici-repentis]KAI1678753.1 hypothetical protein KJE20_12361 [Pyrenophora tritici-repentis]KAI1684363.1 hypothetical protein KJE20_06868 [Pyrenophora tritici-repentis]
MQNEMHSQRRQSDWLFRKLREVMIEECYQYRNSEQPQLDAVFNAKQWEQFVNMAQSKIRISKQCLASLVRTAEYWGMNKVQYYEWASMGVKYCDVLVTAASQNPVWEEARVKLNQLLLRRIAEGRFLRTTANPIYLLDLEHLIAWTDKTNFEKRGRRAYTLKYEPITESDLPVGYGLDQFGLIVTVASQSALSACTTTEVEAPNHLHKGENEFTTTTTAPSDSCPSQQCSRSWQALQIATLLGFCLLAEFFWWHRQT